MKFILIKRIRDLFDRRNARERLLLTVVLGVVALWLTFETLDKLSAMSNTSRSVTGELEYQSAWLERESDFDNRMTAALAQLDASKTYSGNQLLEVMDRITQEVNLETTIARPSSRVGQVFTEHVLVIPLNRVSMGTLIDFENRIKEFYPYLGIDALVIAPEPTAPELLRGEIRVTSFELNNARF